MYGLNYPELAYIEIRLLIKEMRPNKNGILHKDTGLFVISVYKNNIVCERPVHSLHKFCSRKDKQEKNFTTRLTNKL
ncbi:hypothetical protein C0J52_17154 [Blattella germanica]|nr:hypothetical protein C0J52_17154 [Blattella germanica]